MKTRALPAALAAAGLVAALSGCTLANAITPPVEAQLYPTAADGRASNASIPIPSWVPDDATMIRIKENSETGATIMQFTTGAAVLGGACEPGATDAAPALQDTWWPQTLPPVENINCQDGWKIFGAGNGMFDAWR